MTHIQLHSTPIIRHSSVSNRRQHKGRPVVITSKSNELGVENKEVVICLQINAIIYANIPPRAGNTLAATQRSPEGRTDKTDRPTY